jgi:hypothetical protein
VRVIELIKSLVANCELRLRKDATGWHACAKGPVAVAALLVLIILLLFHQH